MPRRRSSARVSANSAGGSCHFGGHPTQSSSGSIFTTASDPGTVGVAGSVPDVDPGRTALCHASPAFPAILNGRSGSEVSATRSSGSNDANDDSVGTRAQIGAGLVHSGAGTAVLSELAKCVPGLVDRCGHFQGCAVTIRSFSGIPSVLFLPLFFARYRALSATSRITV